MFWKKQIYPENLAKLSFTQQNWEIWCSGKCMKMIKLLKICENMHRYANHCIISAYINCITLFVMFQHLVILSICPSIHLWRLGTDPRPGEIDFKFSPYDSLVSLVFRDKISCHWVKGVPTNERAKSGNPFWKDVILPLLARLTWEWLQIGIDMLLIICLTSTGNELFRNINTDDLGWLWTPKIEGFIEFFSILGCDTHFQSKLHRNC